MMHVWPIRDDNEWCLSQPHIIQVDGVGDSDSDDDDDEDGDESNDRALEGLEGEGELEVRESLAYCRVDKVTTIF